MNEEDSRLVIYFDEMCDVLENEKIMFSRWKVYYDKLMDILINGISGIDLNKYITALNDTLVYCEDYGDEWEYKRCSMRLKSFVKQL